MVVCVPDMPQITVMHTTLSILTLRGVIAYKYNPDPINSDATTAYDDIAFSIDATRSASIIADDAADARIRACCRGGMTACSCDDDGNAADCCVVLLHNL